MYRPSVHFYTCAATRRVRVTNPTAVASNQDSRARDPVMMTSIAHYTQRGPPRHSGVRVYCVATSPGRRLVCVREPKNDLRTPAVSVNFFFQHVIFTFSFVYADNARRTNRAGLSCDVTYCPRRTRCIRSPLNNIGFPQCIQYYIIPAVNIHCFDILHSEIDRNKTSTYHPFGAICVGVGTHYI